MSMIFPDFFETNNYFIDEKVGFFKFTNAYKVYDDTGLPIGLIQQKLTAGQKVLRLLLNKKMLPFTLEITDLNGDVLVTIKRGWTFFLSTITLQDKMGVDFAKIKQKFKFIKPEFNILDQNEQAIAKITGDWKGWNFAITNESQQQLGTISKKWNGLLKEAFTTADKYVVTIEPEVAEDVKKMAIVSCAITIDMVLKESK